MSEILWTAASAQKATKGTLHGFQDWQASGVTLDTRKLQEGDLFVAIKGPNFDGHHYIEHALKAGAVACLVSEIPENSPKDAPLLLVQDSFIGLQDLAKFARDRISCPVIGVTGSVGKTGTKEALKHCLSEQGKCYATTGNLNNHFGVPLTLANMPADCDSVIIEMGMNHAEEIRPLSKLARPDVALITTIAPVHIEFFDSVADIARAKAEIFDGVPTDGHLLLNHDDKWFPLLCEIAQKTNHKNVHSFGARTESSVFLKESECLASGSKVVASIFGEEVRYKVGITGHHHILNSLAVLGAIALIQKDVHKAAHCLQTLQPVKGRGEKELIPLKGKGMADRIFTLIDESYNASPISMKAAFQVLGQTLTGKQGRRIAVLGDMLELGEKSPNYHAKLAKDLQEEPIDMVFACGKMMAYLYESLPEQVKSGYAPSSEQLSGLVTEAIQPGDIVMIKGSLGSKMNIIVQDVKALATNPAPSAPAEKS